MNLFPFQFFLIDWKVNWLCNELKDLSNAQYKSENKEFCFKNLKLEKLLQNIGENLCFVSIVKKYDFICKVR